MAGLIAEDLAHDVVRIQAPTLIVWGDQDGFFPRAGQETLARQISHARLLVYAGVGHSPSWETPERLLADMTAFLGIGQGAPDARLSLDASR
jgi:pimeloyl-ACP methyl ester carboxylesterase